jgi:lysophospholipase L1-like esterase
MRYGRHLMGFAALVAIVVAPLACGTSSPPPEMVVIGDSLSAGYQNGSLLDTQQPHGWASLVAQQSGDGLPLPLIAPPGVPAVLRLVSVGPPPVIEQAPGLSIGRTNADDQPYDLAVPGHTLGDVISDTPTLLPTSDEDLITDLVLGLPVGNDKSQMNEAIQLQPKMLFVWAGSNDALQADEAGSPAAMTPVSTFTSEFQQLISTLHSKTSAVLIVANIPDVTVVPYLTPAATILAEVSQATGLSTAQAGALLGIADGDLINATGLSQVEAALAALQQGQTPTPLTDAGFLDPTEIAQIQATIAQYNSVIAAQTAAAGGVLVDLYTYIEGLAQNGITINNYQATNAFLGGLFGLDGIHPTNTAYALIANQFIAAENAAMKTSVPAVNVGAIAAVDPLFGPNIQPTAAVRIPLGAARQADRMILGHSRR